MFQESNDQEPARWRKEYGNIWRSSCLHRPSRHPSLSVRILSWQVLLSVGLIVVSGAKQKNFSLSSLNNLLQVLQQFANRSSFTELSWPFGFRIKLHLPAKHGGGFTLSLSMLNVKQESCEIVNTNFNSPIKLLAILKLGIELESTVSVVDALFTQPLIDTDLRYPLYQNLALAEHIFDQPTMMASRIYMQRKWL